jgi:benzoyl-CoA reductase/2-hydroxyglutaryl-CoA dehydratase subunit BcrC/BadD/HgdB
MNHVPTQLTLDEWDLRRREIIDAGHKEPAYGGPLSRHIQDGDLRLRKLKFDNSPASLDLWNFLLTEEDRLREAQANGDKIVGTMKDLGTVPVLAYSAPNIRAFYPDGAWWIPCIMELSAGLLEIADGLGIDESFCPVRAMLGAFVTEAHFPTPDLLLCSVGAVCDDFAAIAQRLNSLGQPIQWWEMPHRRPPRDDDDSVELPGGFTASAEQVSFVKAEFEEIRQSLESLSGHSIDPDSISEGIKEANRFRASLAKLRRLVFTADVAPLPALELLIAEMLALHFCSDRAESIRILDQLLAEVQERTQAGVGFFGPDATRIFWMNPVADLQVMNLLEECGGRICGTEYLFTHALDQIPSDIEPMEALARTALADPMVGSMSDRAERICHDIKEFGSEALLVSRIPGASHCSLESRFIADMVRSRLGIPTLEIEVPPVSDSLRPALKTRLQGLVEIVIAHREQ